MSVLKIQRSVSQNLLINKTNSVPSFQLTTNARYKTLIDKKAYKNIWQRKTVKLNFPVKKKSHNKFVGQAYDLEVAKISHTQFRKVSLSHNLLQCLIWNADCWKIQNLRHITLSVFEIKNSFEKFIFCNIKNPFFATWKPICCDIKKSICLHYFSFHQVWFKTQIFFGWTILSHCLNQSLLSYLLSIRKITS